jgi:hypothetical protein
MTQNLWQARKLLPGISEGEFTPWEIESHNLKFIKPNVEEKEDDQNYSKKLIQEKLKELRVECFQLIAEGTEDPFAALCNQPRLDRLNKRIRDYQYRLRPVSGHGPGSIGPDDVQLAKQSHIQDFYTLGKLRRQGKDLVGKCPFHSPDKHPSFTIYEDGRRFKCFSCGASGDTIDFYCKLNNLKFIEGVKFILNLK